MFQRLFCAVVLVFSLSICTATAQVPADSEKTISRPDKNETIAWMKLVSQLPAAEQNVKADAALKGITASNSKTPRSDFQLCVGLAYLGNARAQRCVGYAYEKGIGVVDDLLESYVWFELAHGGGDKESASDVARVMLALNSTYPAPSEEELETEVAEQNRRLAEYQKEVKK